MRAFSSSLAGLAVLEVGPLYNNHLRRWSAHAVALGCSVAAAGHVRAERRRVDLGNVTEHVAIAPPGLDDRQRRLWLSDVIARLDPDLIQAHWLPTWGYIATSCAERPTVLTAWGSDVYRTTGAQRSRADWALTHADCVLARSAHMEREILSRGVSPALVSRVDLGVDLQRFRPPANPDQIERLRTRLGLPPGPLIISTRAGTSLYNLDLVLEAFELVRARVENATLVLATGDAPLDWSVQALLDQDPRDIGVRVLGRLPHSEIASYLQAATVGVSIPDSDGSPSSVWEALACGLPMVLSDLPQIAEKVGASGAVKLVEPRRNAVADALISVIENRLAREQMTQAARDWARANCDEREQIERLGAAYEATLQRHAQSRRTAPAAR